MKQTSPAEQLARAPKAWCGRAGAGAGGWNTCAAALCAGLSLWSASSLQAGSVLWSAASAADTNWSTPANWAGGTVPAGGDDVKFFDPGSNAVSGLATSVVDSSFGGWIGSLQYGNTNGFHTTVLAPGVTLNVTNGNLGVYTPGDIAAGKTIYTTITGPGATLNLSNSAASLVINQGASSSGSPRATLDMSGLDNFNATVSRVGIGSTVFPNPEGKNQRDTGTLLLARTNTLTLCAADTLANYQTSGRTNALEMARNPGNSAAMCYLYLGISNLLNVDSLGIGRDKASAAYAGWLGFNPAFTNLGPVAVFRGSSGGSSRVTWWAVGDMNASSSSSQVAVGTNDFNNGWLDAKVQVLSLGRDASSSHTATATILGVFSFNAGLLDVDTAYLGNQTLGPSTSTTPLKGILTVAGSNATLVVNSSLVLGKTTVSSTAAANTAGLLSVNGGKVLANSIAVGSASLNNTIALNNATLVLSNSLASSARYLTTLALTNSTLQLNVSNLAAVVYATNLVTAGTNALCLGSAGVFASYPAEVPLIKYGASSIAGSGYDFVLAGTLPNSALGASLSNNTANQSIDLVIPNDPRPVITQNPVGFSGAPNQDLVLEVTVSAASIQPMSYQWYFNGATALADGPTGNGSTLSGSSSASLALGNIQTADSGNYTVVISNAYGMVTSAVAVLSISTNDIAPAIASISPGNAQMVIQGNAASFALSTSGSPAPDYYWFDNNNALISGAHTATLGLPNVQYSQQGTYSVIVSNRAGTATTNMSLTVIVTPAIGTQPQTLTVTNGASASFSVAATGIPAPSYQWFKGATALAGPGAQTATLSLSSVSPSDMGSYSVVVSNAAGSVLSSNASLLVDSATLALLATCPTNGQSGLCIDTPLVLQFNGSVSNGAVGRICLYNATNASTPVDVLDMSLSTSSQAKVIGGATYTYYPALVSGTTAAIYFHSNLLYNQSYFITVDPGVFKDAVGAYFAGFAATNAWTFSTRPAGPLSGTNRLVVAADGSADFCTVQGAVDAVTSNSLQRVLIFVRTGYYQEILNLNSARSNVTVRGEDRKLSVIAYPNNATLQSANGGSTSARCMVNVGANDVAFENLTLTNSTPYGGSQAEALRVAAARFVFLNGDLDSFQDTLIVNSAGNQAYFQDCYIQGDTDYTWGSGTAYFTNTVMKAMHNGYMCQPRNPQGQNGFAWVRCPVLGAAGVTNNYLARSAGDAYPYGQCVYVSCLMDTNSLNAGGWNLGGISNPSTLKFWEFQSLDTNGNLVNTSGRASWSAQIDAATAAGVVDVTNWFGGWQPQLAPNILTNPVGQNLKVGDTLALSVSATGVPAPTYQWLRNGISLEGQTAATLVIVNAQVSDSGAYSVVVSTPAGSVTSSSALVGIQGSANTAPVFAPLSPNSFTLNVGQMLRVTNQAADADLPAQTLTYSLLSAPEGAMMDSVSGVFSWRPAVSQANSQNTVVVTVFDDGSPSLGATNTFMVTVNPLTEPTLSAVGYSAAGQFHLTVDGQSGPDYVIWASTNLVDWTALCTNSSLSMPLDWTDTNAQSFPMRFYRIGVGPVLP